MCLLVCCLKLCIYSGSHRFWYLWIWSILWIWHLTSNQVFLRKRKSIIIILQRALLFLALLHLLLNVWILIDICKWVCYRVMILSLVTDRESESSILSCFLLPSHIIDLGVIQFNLWIIGLSDEWWKLLSIFVIDFG